MFRQQVLVLNMGLMILDSICIICSGYAAYQLKSYESYWLWEMDDYWFSLSVLLVMFVNNAAMGKMGLYSDIRTASYWKLGRGILHSIIIDFAALSSVVFIFHKQDDYSRAFLLYFMGFTFLFVLLARFAANFYLNGIARHGFNTRRLLIIGDTQRGQLVLAALNRQVSLGHQIVDSLAIGGSENCAESLAHLPDILINSKIDEVIFAVPKDEKIKLRAYLGICSRMGIPARILPALWNPDKLPMRVEQCQEIPFLTLNFNRLNITGRMYKRMLDLAGSLVGMLILGMVYPVIAIAIKCDSKGPVFFKQDRIGQNGRLFKLYKFRSMYMNAEERKKEFMYINQMLGPIFKIKDDPRVTRVGRFLRRTSLDELPQFLNVLKGEMSLVGTRPPTPGEVRQYALSQYKRISAKPGITGLWQVSGRNQITDFNEVVRLDCQYLENWRFRKDIIILLKTFWVVLARKGAM